MKLTDEQIAEGWLEHDGGPCPITREQWVTLRFRDGETARELGACIPPAIWNHIGDESDVIAYRPEPHND